MCWWSFCFASHARCQLCTIFNSSLLTFFLESLLFHIPWVFLRALPNPPAWTSLTHLPHTPSTAPLVDLLSSTASQDPKMLVITMFGNVNTLCKRNESFYKFFFSILFSTVLLLTFFPHKIIKTESLALFVDFQKKLPSWNIFKKIHWARQRVDIEDLGRIQGSSSWIAVNWKHL